MLRNVQKFSAHERWTSAAICALKQFDSETTLEVLYTATQSRLPDIEYLCRTSQTTMLRSGNRPFQIAEFDVHQHVLASK